MKIGEKKYEIESSEIYVIIRPGDFEYLSLSLNIWCKSPDTYWLAAPIKLNNIKGLIKNRFQSDFKIQDIVDIDSTLLVENEAINVWHQKIVFDNFSLFELKNFKIIGETFEGTKLNAKGCTSFCGFEIWKNRNYESEVKKIQSVLNELSIKFSTMDEIENELIRIELINRA